MPGAESEHLSGLRVLLVEDSWHIAVAFKNLLRSLGAEVIGPVATTADAERAMSEQIPDVGIIDFNLRGGEQARGLIDKLNAHDIPVIVVSGYASVPLAPAKAAVILQKPIAEAQLLEALGRVSARKKAG